jgi:hypothetical protein
MYALLQPALNHELMVLIYKSSDICKMDVTCLRGTYELSIQYISMEGGWPDA